MVERSMPQLNAGMASHGKTRGRADLGWAVDHDVSRGRAESRAMREQLAEVTLSSVRCMRERYRRVDEVSITSQGSRGGVVGDELSFVN